MNGVFRDVFDFHVKFGARIGTTPAVPDSGTVALRTRILQEECDELREAMEAGDLPGVADACADAIYVIVGLAISYGIDLRPVWDAVHAANMSKTGGNRADGKVLKGEGFRHPDVAGILARQHSLETLTQGRDTP